MQSNVPEPGLMMSSIARTPDLRPDKELITQLLQDESPETFTKFFVNRTTWCGGYPYGQQDCSTYCVFDDLFESLRLKTELRQKLIPIVLKNALDLPDQYFHCALFVLAQMIPDDRRSPRPLNFSDVFLVLQKRAEKLSFLPNLSGAWDRLALNQRYLIGSNDPLRKFYANDLRLKEDWRGYFNSPLPNTLQDGIRNCQADTDDLQKRIQEMGCDPKSRELFYVTEIEQTRYWVWDMPAKHGESHLSTMVALRQPANGDLGLLSWVRYEGSAYLRLPVAISNALMQTEYRILNNLPVVRRLHAASE